MLSKKWFSFPCHCRLAPTPWRASTTLWCQTILSADGGWLSQVWPTKSKATGQLLLGQLAWNKGSDSYLQSKGGSASWLSKDCTSWSAHNSFQTIWHSFRTLNLPNTTIWGPDCSDNWRSPYYLPREKKKEAALTAKSTTSRNNF